MEKSERHILSSLEATRLQNMKNMFAKYQEEFGSEQCLKEGEQEDENVQTPYKKSKKWSFTQRRSLQPTRRSSRISGEKVTDYAKLGDDEDDDDRNIQSGIKRRKSSTPRIVIHQTRERVIKNIEDITEDEINTIWYKSSGKTYSALGSTCHQCRQKTIDTKSICWSKTCVGVRGQFCGFCLKNRYGEDVAEALRNSDWICPPCRGICNCSICRTREGKLPTGILAPYIKSDGFKSVKEFLESREAEVKAEGDEYGEDKKMEMSE